MTLPARGVPPRPRLPTSPTPVVAAGGTMLPSSVAARQSGCPPGYPGLNCPCATAPPAAGGARPRCRSARPHQRRQSPKRRARQEQQAEPLAIYWGDQVLYDAMVLQALWERQRAVAAAYLGARPSTSTAQR